MAPRWTVRRLTEACWQALQSGSVRVRFRAIQGASALIETEGDGATIIADGFQAGDLQNIAHELTHYVLENHWPRMFGRDVEEAIVVALEDQIVRYVNRTPREQKRWRKALGALRKRGTP